MKRFEVPKMGDSFGQSSGFLNVLPLQVRLKIYGKVNNADLLNLRLVNSVVRKEIEQLVGLYVVILPCFNSGYQKLLKYRINTCRVENWEKMKLIPGKPIFAHPQHVKRLIVGGFMDKPTLERVLQECTNLQDLRFEHSALKHDKMLNNPVVTRCLANLTHLTHLELFWDKHYFTVNVGGPANVETLLSQHFPVLKSIQLKYHFDGDYSKLLQFLQRHSSTLQNVVLTICPDRRTDMEAVKRFLESQPHARQLDNVDLVLLGQLRLKKFELVDRVLHLNPTAFQIFRNLIRQQTSLECLALDMLNCWNGDFVRHMVALNRNSLKEICVENLIGAAADHGRSLGFSKCEKLEQLRLSCQTQSRPGFLKLTQLPSSLEILPLSCFNFAATPTGLIEFMVGSAQLDKLRKIRLHKCNGIMASFAISCLLKNCKRLVFLEFTPINLSLENQFGRHFLDQLFIRLRTLLNQPVDASLMAGGVKAELSQDPAWVNWVNSLVVNPRAFMDNV